MGAGGLMSDALAPLAASRECGDNCEMGKNARYKRRNCRRKQWFKTFQQAWVAAQKANRRDTINPLPIRPFRCRVKAPKHYHIGHTVPRHWRNGW